MKRMLLLMFCIVAFAADAQAISRYNSTSMSCASIHAKLQNEGAAILRYQSTRNPSLTLYGRYVPGRQSCKIDEYAESVSIPAADTPSCRVYECKQAEFDDGIFLYGR